MLCNVCVPAHANNLCHCFTALTVPSAVCVTGFQADVENQGYQNTTYTALCGLHLLKCLLDELTCLRLLLPPCAMMTILHLTLQKDTHGVNA